MGVMQRKHPATAAGQRHISLASSSQSTAGWRQFCHQPAKTVWMIFLRTRWFALSVQGLQISDDNGGFVALFFSRAFESEVRMYEGDDPLDVWDRWDKYVNSKFCSNVLLLNLWCFIFNLHLVLSFIGILSGQSKPSLREVKRAILTHCWNELWKDLQMKRNITTTLAMLTSGSNLYVWYFSFYFYNYNSAKTLLLMNIYVRL